MTSINSDYISPPRFGKKNSCSECYCLFSLKIILVALIVTMFVLWYNNKKEQEDIED